MNSELMHDRGRGPEVKGTRITVYNMMSYFLDPTMTEARISALYDLTPEQVAAARAYVLNNADTVLAKYLRIEERIAAESGSDDPEKARQVKATFLKFKAWLEEREEAAARERADEVREIENQVHPSRFPTFREWLHEQESRPGSRS